MSISNTFRLATAIAYILVSVLIVAFLCEFVKTRNGRARVLLNLVFISWALTGVESFTNYIITVYYPSVVGVYRQIRIALPVTQIVLLIWLNIEARRARH